MAGASVTYNFDFAFEAEMGRLLLNVHLQSYAQMLVLIGPNGSGKSSFLRALLGLVPINKGYITVRGRQLDHVPIGLGLATEQRRLGYVPQSYGLFPHLTVEQQLTFAVQCHFRERAAQRSSVRAALEQWDLVALAGRRSHELSGGQRQRVALARALIGEPLALLLDEPLAAQDVQSREQVREALHSHLNSITLPVIMVTHDPEDVKYWPHCIAVMDNGRLHSPRHLNEVLPDGPPASPQVSGFLQEFLARARRQVSS